MRFCVECLQTMAKGLEKFRERRLTLSHYGKDLTRRARSRCELCQVAGVSLEVVELPPVPVEPDYERCLFLCEQCASELLREDYTANPQRWHCLNNAVWSEVPVVQATSVRILRVLAKSEPWASELLEQVYLEPEVEALV